jgi:glucosamine kinase
MIIICDSGSTKADWILVDEKANEIAKYKTMGFNPYFHDSALIENTLKADSAFMKHTHQISYVFFYGAGCSSKEKVERVQTAFKVIFPNAKIHIGHDVEAAAYAVYNGKPEIACILGTGSNSCFFDGNTVHEEIPALAYILGDEGSGSYIGKKFLAAFLYKKLPQHIADDFYNEYKLDKESIFEAVYRKPNANVFLASLVRFIAKYKEDEFIRNIVKQGFLEFTSTHVFCFKNYKELEVNFIGSIAFYLSDILYEVAEIQGFTIGRIIKSPIDTLVAYHVKKHPHCFNNPSN